MPRFAPAALGSPLDPATQALVRLAAIVAGGTEHAIRGALTVAVRDTPPQWIEELILQTYLFAGFPRALNATREWRRIAADAGAPADARATSGGEPFAYEASTGDAWRARGEATCATVYGGAYERLRRNITTLHPALDEWMIVEGYGKVLSRPGLDLGRRELCIVAACAHTAQARQLHSHLHGAANAGVPPAAVDATFDALADILSSDALRDGRLLWARVIAQRS